MKPKKPPRVRSPILEAQRKNPPGGPHTPGAKAARKKALATKKAKKKKKRTSTMGY